MAPLCDMLVYILIGLLIFDLITCLCMTVIYGKRGWWTWCTLSAISLLGAIVFHTWQISESLSMGSFKLLDHLGKPTNGWVLTAEVTVDLLQIGMNCCARGTSETSKKTRKANDSCCSTLDLSLCSSVLLLIFAIVLEVVKRNYC